MLQGICLAVVCSVFSTNLASASVRHCLKVNSGCSGGIGSTAGDGMLASSSDSKLSGVAMQGCRGICAVSVMDWPSCYWASLLGSLHCQLNWTPVGLTSSSLPWKSQNAVMWKAMLVNTTTYSNRANMEYTGKQK